MELELKGDKLSNWLMKKAETDWSPEWGNSQVAILPDREGMFDTAFGSVEFKFESKKNCEGEYSARLIIDCSKCPVLQSRRRKNIRMVDINRDGVGIQNLRDNVYLVVRTKTDLDQYRSLTRTEINFRKLREETKEK